MRTCFLVHSRQEGARPPDVIPDRKQIVKADRRTVEGDEMPAVVVFDNEKSKSKLCCSRATTNLVHVLPSKNLWWLDDQFRYSMQVRNKHDFSNSTPPQFAYAGRALVS